MEQTHIGIGAVVRPNETIRCGECPGLVTLNIGGRHRICEICGCGFFLDSHDKVTEMVTCEQHGGPLDRDPH